MTPEGTIQKTPVSLLMRVQREGRAEDWARLVNLLSPLLYDWSRRMGLSENDAADLVQEVFAVLVTKLPEFQYDPQKTFRGWLRTVGRNKWREMRRRRSETPTGTEELNALAAADDPDPYWDVEFREHLAARALEIMRSQFQPTTWRACWEHVVSGRTAAEVARELGISEGAVYVAKSRVLRRLRRELQGLLD